ncbi:hypothetical protein HDU80_009641 [Chytriomyces hyalinus]|nr:hypothetical protein HDU80_009641 [Chytriomyces hyalinus]
MLQHFPVEIVSSILLWLSIPDAVRQRRLSHSFNSLVCSEGFARRHVAQHNPPIVYCNGYIFLAKQSASIGPHYYLRMLLLENPTLPPAYARAITDALFSTITELYVARLNMLALQNHFIHRFKVIKRLRGYGASSSLELPTELGKCETLENISLTQCNIPGSIPVSLSDLKNLLYLDLSENCLSGHIPSELTLCVKLTHLILNNNQLYGPIPAEIGNLTALQILCLHNNELSGGLPASLSHCRSLTKLDLSGNSLAGELPWFQNPELSWMSLDHLDMSRNQLSGALPDHLSAICPSLETLNLSYNRFTKASIPPAWGNLAHLLELDLACCGIVGAIPEELGNLGRLKSLNLGLNGLRGEIPKSFGMLAQLQKLSLNGNCLHGWVPVELEQLQSLILANIKTGFGNAGIVTTIPKGVMTDSRLYEFLKNQGFKEAELEE